jgi:hypothetical protein
MSEYQYYEFAAVDQLLTEQAQSELRSRSTRATITASCFINEYHWGNLKGEPLDWVERFFDAHVYSSSWGKLPPAASYPTGRHRREAHTRLRAFPGSLGERFHADSF